MRFCGQCGAPLAAGRAPQASREPRAERRHLTVLFCDLARSTELAERLDPEDLRELVCEYQAVAGRIVDELEGHVAQHLGDGILVYFGYPRAHEDDPCRAVKTGLRIVQAMAELNHRLELQRGLRVAVRLGIHTGPVVAGEVGSGATREQLAIGQVPNVAARLQSLADPDTVLLSGATYRLVQGLFACRPLGARNLKGVSEPVDVFEACGDSAAGSRFEAALHRGLLPFVGRRRELERMLEAFAAASRGAGSVALLTGEAGLGKSRLVHQFRERLAAEPHGWLPAHCSPYGRNSAFQPIIGLLSDLLAMAPGEAPEAVWEKLERLVGEPGPDTAILGSLLSLPASDRHPLPDGSPALLRENTFASLLRVWRRLSARRPLVLVVEDLHWSDPSTLEMVRQLSGEARGLSMLLLLTARPELSPPWLSPALSLSLDRLTEAEAEDLVNEVAGGRKLPEELVRHIAGRTDGIPLYVEELTRMTIESGDLVEQDGRFVLRQPSVRLAIPTTLQGSLVARLDQLGPARRTAQLAAAIGREFDLSLLAAASPLPEDEVQRDLDHLVAAQLVVPGDDPRRPVFVFRHALIQEAAYECLVRKERSDYHGRIARLLEEGLPGIESSPQRLAHHFALAGRFEAAVRYAHQAGLHFLTRSAYYEAIEHLNDGLRWLQELPDTPERARLELELRGSLVPALMATRGYGAEEVESCLARSLALTDGLERETHTFPTLWGLWSYYQLRGRNQEALQMAERLHGLAAESRDSGLMIEGLNALAVTKWYLGMFDPSVAGFEEVEALYDPAAHRGHAFIYGQDPRLFARAQKFVSLWYLGRPARALALAADCLLEAEAFGHANTTCMVLEYTATLYQYCGEAGAVAEYAGRLLALCQRHGLQQWQALGTALESWAQVHQGGGDIGQLAAGVKLYESIGARMSLTYLSTLLAEAHVRLGSFQEGLKVLEQSIATSRDTGETFHLPEMLRRHGDWLLLLPDADPRRAEASYRECIAVARRQNARQSELYAAASLARLLSGLRRGDEGSRILAEARAAYPGGAEERAATEARSVLALQALTGP